jgi:GTPase SAR1 family protein
MTTTLEDNCNALWRTYLEKLNIAEEAHGLDEQRFKFSVPRIVAIGEESSGKSSTLERIAMLKIFPSDRRLCTRMPIELRLRHCDEAKLPEEYKETGFVEMSLLRCENSRIPEQAASPRMQPNEVADKVREWMETIVSLNNETGTGAVTGVTSDRLLIKLFSTRKLNLDLIDLPGIVAGSIRDEPSDMMDRTRKIAGSYLDDINNPHTFVIAVVSATETRIRNSQAMELVQRYNKAKMTIGVLTMADLAGDPRSNSNPYEILKGRLDGNADDLPSIDLGYFALKNRDTSVTTENVQDLVRVNEEEKSWFEENLPDHTSQCGINSLIAQLVHMLEKYMLEKWVKAERERLSTLREEVASKLVTLGSFIPSDVTNLVERFHIKLSERANKMAYSTALKFCDYSCMLTRPPIITAPFVSELKSPLMGWEILDAKKDKIYDQKMFLNGWVQLFKFDAFLGESTLRSIEEKCSTWTQICLFFIGEKHDQNYVRGIFVPGGGMAWSGGMAQKSFGGGRNLLNELNQLFSSTLSPSSSQLPVQTTNAFGQRTELIPNDGKKFVLVIVPPEREVRLVPNDRRLNEEKYYESIIELRNIFNTILMECIEKYWDNFVKFVIDDYRLLDGRFENFCNSVETILRTRGRLLFHKEVKSVIIPWIQIHLDNALVAFGNAAAAPALVAFGNAAAAPSAAAAPAENNDAQMSAASKVFSEHFNVLFRRTAKLNFATPLSSKFAEELHFNLRSITDSLSIDWFVSMLGSENTLCTENCEAERNTLTHSKESAITMLNALTEAFLNVEIAEAQETTNDAHPAVQQNNPFTP